MLHACTKRTDETVILVKLILIQSEIIIIELLLPSCSIYGQFSSAPRTDFHEEFRMRYNGTEYITKLRRYENANVHTLDHNSLETNNVNMGQNNI
jgi:hypothetical protein